MNCGNLDLSVKLLKFSAVKKKKTQKKPLTVGVLFDLVL